MMDGDYLAPFVEYDGNWHGERGSRPLRRPVLYLNTPTPLPAPRAEIKSCKKIADGNFSIIVLKTREEPEWSVLPHHPHEARQKRTNANQ